MANQTLTDLTELTAVQDGDFLYIVDVSDTTDSPDGTGKKITKFNLNLDNVDFLGSIVPTSTPTGTGKAYWLAAQAGTYTNFGGLVVSANSLAVISRNATNAFSISQTPLDITSLKMQTWTAKAYDSGDQVNYLGKDWVANAATVAGDVPSVSSKWVERLDALLSKNDVLPISKKLTDNLSNITVKKEVVKLVNGGFYNYKTGVYSANASFAGLSITAVEGDIFSFKGAVGFSSLAAISFFDNSMNNIGYIFGDNTSTVINRDTGIIMCPKRTATVIFGAYIAGGVEVEVFKYNLNQFVDSVFNKDIIDVYNKVSVPTSFSTTNDGVYDRNGILLVPAGFPTATNYKYTSIDVIEGDVYNYTSVAFYGSNVFGILMLDVNNNVLERRYTTGSFAVFQDFNETFVIPKNCKKILVNLKKNDQSKISKLSITADKFLTQQDVNTLGNQIKYTNAWDYRFRSAISSDFVNSGFTYDSVNKVATSNVANSYLLLNKNFKTYKRKHIYYLKLNSSTVVEIGSSAVNNSVAYQSRNSLILLDIPNLKLKILDINTLSLLSETSISGFIAGDYSVEIIVNDLTLTAVLRNNNTLVATTVSYTSTPVTSPQGKLIDFPTLKLVSGSVSVISTQIFLIYKPLIVFVGDSITESGYRVNSYAQKLLETDFGNNGTILAKGGANHDVLIGNTLSEIIKIKPQFLSILIGTNGGFISSQISVWKTFCDANDIKLIINVIPISNNETTYPYLTTIDNILTADNYGARFDLASSINNVVSNGQNTSLFLDALHPNDEGHNVLRNRFIIDIKL